MANKNERTRHDVEKIKGLATPLFFTSRLSLLTYASIPYETRRGKIRDKRKASGQTLACVLKGRFPMNDKRLTQSNSSGNFQLPLFDESDAADEFIEAVTADGIRMVKINNEAYASLYDLYKVHGHSSNPRTDWARDKVALAEQGQPVADLIQHDFTGKDGKRKPPTPVVNLEQLARIAQVAKIKEWEPLRQEMARLFAESQKETKTTSVRQSKGFRQHLDAGYNPEQAESALEVRQEQKKNYRRLTNEWQKRGAKSARDYSSLNNAVTEAATGKTATEWKQEYGIKDSPREKRFSALKNGLVNVVQWLAPFYHQSRDSQGASELLDDIVDVGKVINKEELARQFPDLDLLPPASKSEQPKLITDGESVTDE